MNKIDSWLILMLFFVLPTQQYAQPYYFNHYQINDGLSNNTVICSMQDSFGFLWLGTKDGLDRFDGNNFKHFDIRNHVLNTVANNIISLIEDNEKKIWIGTDQGIYIYNPIHETFALLSEEFANADVPVIKKDSKNNIWFIANQSLYFYNYSKKNTTKINVDENNISALFCSKEDKLYYGTFNGKICLVEKFRSTILIDLEQKHGPKDWFAIQKIIKNEKGNLIFGTSKAGVGSVAKDNTVTWLLGIKQLKQYLYVRDILQMNEQEYWFATESGLFIYNIETKKFINIKKAENNPWGISDNAIYNILKDKDGGIWLGTYFGGINYYHKNNNLIEKFMSKTQGGNLLGTVVRGINKDKNGNIWLGTENGGLSKLNPITRHIENYNIENAGLSDNNIHGLLPYEENILLGAFVYGMDIFNTQSKKVIYHTEYDANSASSLKSNFLYDIKKSKSGEILIATTRGHYTFDITNKSFSPITKVPTEMSYTTLLEDSKGYIWLGTWRNGLYMYHPSKNIIKHFAHEPNNPNSLPDNKVNSIFEDSNGKIWIATEGGLGKIILNKNIEFDFQNPEIKLPSKIVFAVLEDKHKNIWITTSKGLIRYNQVTNNTRLFNIESGLPSIQFNYNSSYDDGAGKFYFGTINGMIRFEPEKLNQIKYNSNTPIYITRLTVNNKEINQNEADSVLKKSILFTDEIILKYNESSFNLDFTALLYDSPHAIKYSYKLDGVNKDWVTTNGSTSAHFTKLLPGNYDFIVKAEDPNGIPFSSERKLRIKILPPTWASIPAFVLYFVIIICLILFIAYHFNERIKQKNKEHLLTIQNLREQELYQSKIDFYTDVVHEIRTPLTLIKAPLEKLIDKIPSNPITDKLLKNIQNNTERLISLSNQLLDFRKVDTQGFKFHFELKDISASTQELVENYKVTLDSQHKKLSSNIEPNITCDIDLEAYDIICNNLLNNALKYSYKTIKVNLQRDSVNCTLILSIKNDGILIKEVDREYIFEPFNRLKHSKSIPGSGLGLSLAQSLAIKLNGIISYSIDNENLNTFTLRLPLNQT